MKLTEPDEIRFTDIAIVGSGMGGGTLALALADQGVRCTLFESGGDTNSNARTYTQVDGRDFGLRSTTRMGLGGTTNLWHGLVAPLEERDFERVSQETGRPLWPFNREELRPYYNMAIEHWMGSEFEVAESDFEEHTTDFEGALPSWKERRYFQKRPLRSLRSDLLKAVDGDTIDLLANCRVVAVSRSADGSYNVVAIWAGKIITKNFKRVVVAAGALESPAILLRSKIENNNIGCYLMDHPMAPLITLRLSKKRSYSRYSGEQKRGAFHYHAIRPTNSESNLNLMVRPSFAWSANFETEKLAQDLLCLRDGDLSIATLWNVLKRPKFVLQLLQYKFALPLKFEIFDYYAVVEQSPSRDSKVYLLDEQDAFGFKMTGVKWVVQETDIAPVRAVYDILRARFGPSGCAHYQCEFDWDKRLISAAHHAGTCRMGDDATWAVTNENGQVFNYRGLYVCDASAIPAVGSANLGLTITALSFRLASILAGELTEEKS